MENPLNKKRVLLVGGVGVIGQILIDNLCDIYELIIADVRECSANMRTEYIQLDITNYTQTLESIPKDVDVIVNLVAIGEQPDLVDADMMSDMTDVYIKGTYNLFLAATELGIPKVIFASSNHVTDHYEKEGRSLLGHDISVDDYPFSKSVYGALKLAGESFGHVFSIQKGLSVICLRIGTVLLDEKEALLNNPRFRRTLLSKIDLINLFRCSIEAPVNFGIYYGVSDNPGKPWSTANAAEELGFNSLVSSSDLLS